MKAEDLAEAVGKLPYLDMVMKAHYIYWDRKLLAPYCLLYKLFNRSPRRKRGMASNKLFIIPDLFFCIFPMNFAMATLDLKEMGKFLWESLEKSLPS